MNYKLLFMLLAFVAQVNFMFADDEVPTAQLTFVVDDADRVSISIAGDELSGIHTGSNTVEVMQWSNVTIAPKEGCSLKSVVDSQNQELTISGGSVTFMVYEAVPATYVITSEKVSEVSFTIDVDDPSKVKVLDCEYKPVALSAGNNSLEMNALKFPLIVGASNYGDELYQVLFDGEEVESYYGSYSVTPVDGSVITIRADFPDIECRVDFSYPEGIRSFFTAVCVNGENVPVDDVMDVRCGDIITLYYNASCWDTEEAPVKISINGTDVQWFWSGYSFVVKENTSVSVDQATAVDMITVTVEADKPGNIVVYRVDKEYRDIVNIQAGQNVVELPKEYANLVITNVEADGKESKITGITINGTPATVAYYNEVELRDLDQDDVVKIFTEGDFGGSGTPDVPLTVEPAAGSIVNSLSSVMIYLDADFDYDDETDLFEVVDEDGIYFTHDGEYYCGAISNIDIETIQIVPSQLIYAAGEYSLVIEKGALAWMTEEGGEFVANEEDLAYSYTVEGIATDISGLPFTLDPAPGSKVESLEVVMSINDGYDEIDVAETMVFVCRDGKIVCGIYGDISDDYTSVTIIPEEEITEPGTYDLVFMTGAVMCEGRKNYYNAEPLVFSYTLDSTSSTAGIISSDNRNEGVYNILGVKVADSTDGLPAGIYIVNGKKIYVK